VYVAKVKNLLVGLPPTDDEIAQVTKDPTALGALVDSWIALPQYDQKMRTFFELAFQQTQITSADFADLIPKNGIGNGPGVPALVQNVRESFARTVLAIVQSGRPLTDAFTTKQLMLTPALMELYAFMDTRHVDDPGKITDAFAKEHVGLTMYFGTAPAPIPIEQTLDPTSANYMHWYSPDVATLVYPVAACNVDPIPLPVDAYSLHLLLYGGVDNHHIGNSGNCGGRGLSAASVQMLPGDFSTWRLVTLRAPVAGEAITTFYDLPALRAATELVLKTPHPGFFSTPAFFANWSTNQSNQMRVTLNQALIVATGMAVDGTDATSPPSTPGLDAAHALNGSACFSCHQTLDPTRSIFSATYSYSYNTQNDPLLVAQVGLFAFQGVIAPVTSIDDFATLLATHPAVPQAWAQKLCYYLNSSPCSADDPELQRIVAAWKSANLSWNVLVKMLASSPLTTNAAMTKTTAMNGEVVAVVRRDHLCAALDSRLGLVDVCGRDVGTKKTTVPQIVAGLPSDGYGRGATIPVLPNQPTLFYRAGLENICENLAGQLIDAAQNPATPNAKRWSSMQPDAAIADFVGTMMALTPSDPRASQAEAILMSHFTAAKVTGASASNALKSTFIVACLSPSSIGIGM